MSTEKVMGSGRVLTIFAVLLLAGAFAFGETDSSAVSTNPQTSALNGADIAWVLMSSALVMLMTPGLAFFYGGLVRRKNFLSVLMQCFIVLGVLSLQWIIIGYSLSFAPGKGYWGGFDWMFLKNVGFEPFTEYAPTIPHKAFMIFQSMFAVITPALIIGAFAERMKFSAFIVFTLLWATFVYDPVAHWVWGSGGWLKTMGVVDFAGGIVVHINAGIAALVTALIIGKRTCYDKYSIPPHNLPFSILGTGLLWFGWFGFNAGSALAANSVAVNAFITTNTAGAAAAIVWALLDWKFNGNPTILGTISGAIAGLAAVTPGAGYVDIGGAVIIGVVSSVLCFIFVSYVKKRLGYDDSLDAFGIHGVGGVWGTIATGLFATTAVNPAGVNGLFFGNPRQLWIQLLASAVTAVYIFVATWIIFKLVDKFIGVRVAEKDEAIGLDLTQHNERAYTMLE